MNTYPLQENEYRRALDFKRDLHMHPELSRREYRTTDKIRDFLGGLSGFREIRLPVETGLAAQLRGNADGPEIMLRADIDALPQTELFESPWKSRTEGVMHACGHDLHTAALLGAAMILSRLREEGTLPGTVDFVFQSAEEGTTGARELIDSGLFNEISPVLCFGMHNWPSVRTGYAVVEEGARMAAKRNFEIRIYGEGGHGSMPHLNRDPIVCAAAVIQSLQTIVSRNTDPLDAVVLSVNMIEGGSPVNLVVESVKMRATIRSLSDSALSRAIERTKTIVRMTAEAYECRSEILWQERIPAVWNSPEMTAIAGKCARAAGCPQAKCAPSLASEDFALYRSFVPSFYYWIGSTSEGEQAEALHRPLFHTEDAALGAAASLYAASAIEGMRSLSSRIP